MPLLAYQGGYKSTDLFYSGKMTMLLKQKQKANQTVL